MKRSSALIASLATVLAAATQRSARGADLPTIRLGYDPIDSSSNLLAASTQGFFTKAGVSVELAVTKNGTAGAAALLAGSLDVSQINIASLIAARQKSIPFSMIALGTLYTSKSGHALVVGKDSILTSARDLTGKTIGVNAIGGGLDWFAARTYVDKNGGDSTKVRFTEMPFSMMSDAVDARRIDAAVIDELYLSVAMSGGSRVLGYPYDAIGPTFLISGSIATAGWVTTHADAAHRFNAAMHQGAIWANHNRDKTAEILSKLANVDIDALKRTHRATFAESQQNVVALVQPVIDTIAKYGASPSALTGADLLSKEVFHLS